MKTRRWDLIVIGGGPAGATLAALAKKYHPDRAVLILEARPSFDSRRGELLLPAAAPVLAELGALELVEKAGFLRSAGALHVWGRRRRAWAANFGGEGRPPSDWRGRSYGWHVPRGRYDELLLAHARGLGVEVLRPARASGWTRSADGGFRLRLESGPGPERLEAGFVADCSGFRPRGARRAGGSGFSAWASFRCRDLAASAALDGGSGRLLLESSEDGWLWCLPVSESEVTAGFAAGSAPRALADAGLDSFLAGKLERSRVIAGVLSGSEPLTAAVSSRLSAGRRPVCGEGWIAAGDAAGPGDPLLSTGLFTAHLTACRAAYGVGAAWAAAPALRARLRSDYRRFIGRLSGAFFQMALLWYGEERFESRLSEFLSASVREPSDPIAGLGDAMLRAEGGLALEALRRSRGVKPAGERSLARPPRTDRWRPRLVRPLRLVESWDIRSGTGALERGLRAHFGRRGAGGRSALDPALPVSLEEARVLALLARGAAIADMVKALSPTASAESEARFVVNNLLQGLAAGGLVR